MSGLYAVNVCFSEKTDMYACRVWPSLVALLTGAQNKTRHCLVAIRIYIQKWVGFISGFRSNINPLYIYIYTIYIQYIYIDYIQVIELSLEYFMNFTHDFN